MRWEIALNAEESEAMLIQSNLSYYPEETSPYTDTTYHGKEEIRRKVIAARIKLHLIIGRKSKLEIVQNSTNQSSDSPNVKICLSGSWPCHKNNKTTSTMTGECEAQISHGCAMVL